MGYGNNPFNQLFDCQAERLALLLEELGEAQQAIGKILRHGYDASNPEIRNGKTNRESLELELGDVLGAIYLLTHARDLNERKILGRKKYKLVKVKKYLHHQ